MRKKDDEHDGADFEAPRRHENREDVGDLGTPVGYGVEDYDATENTEGRTKNDRGF